MLENKTAALLTKLRKDNNYTQIDLSEKLGVSYQAVSKWERGENLPDSRLLLDIAKLYKITVDEILRGELLNKKEEGKKNSRRNKLIFIFAIVLLMISPISIFIFGYENYDIYVIIILSIAAISVAMLLFISFDVRGFVHNEELSKGEKRQQDMVYATCAGIFLILGLVFNLWYIAWVVFIFGYVVTLFLKKE